MKDGYRKTDEDFQKTLVFMDEIDEKLNKKIEEFYRKYNRVFYDDDLLKYARGRVMSMVAPTIEYDDATLDRALNEVLLERMNKNKLWLRKDILKLSEMINFSNYYECKDFCQDYNEDFSFRMDFLTRISNAMEYSFDKERLDSLFDNKDYIERLNCNEFMENLITEYDSKLKVVNKNIYSRIDKINKLGVMEFESDDILYLIWKKIYAFGRGSKIRAIKMIDSNTLYKIIDASFNELYYDKKIEVKREIYKVYKYILNNPIKGEYEFNDKFKNNIVYAMRISSIICDRVIDDKNKIDYSMILDATYKYINEKKIQKLEKIKENSIKKEKQEKSAKYKVKKILKNSKIKIYVLGAIMVTLLGTTIKQYDESKEMAIDSFTPGINRENIYTVNNDGYMVLVDSVVVFYNNVMEKYDDSSLALVGMYEAYSCVKQDRLSIMDKMLMDLKQYSYNNPECSDFFNEIMPYENFAQYAYARLVSLGCEDVDKYSEVVSRYSEVRRKVGSAIIEIDKNGLTEMEDFMKLYRREEEKVRNDLANKEMNSVRMGAIK